MTTFKANRKFPNPITVTDDPKSHTLALQQIIEALNVGQRRTREIDSSYVRVHELVDVGLIEIVGNQLKLTNLGAAVAAGGITALADLTDVDLTGLSNGDVLIYNSATLKWEAGAVTGGFTDLYDQTLNNLADVAFYLPSDGDVLTYNAATGMWDAASPAGIYGRHTFYVSAGAMLPSAAGGCQPLARIPSAASQPDIVTLNFDATTQEFAQFSVRMPKSWDEGTITFAPTWSHPSTTTNFGVVWELQAVALANGDAIATAYGTAQSSTDTGGSTDTLYIGPESSAITVAGSPAAEEVVHFRIARAPANASDNLAVDARLHGVTIYLTTNANTDA